MNTTATLFAATNEVGLGELFVRMIISLGVVLGIVLGAYWIIKRRRGGGSGSGAGRSLVSRPGRVRTAEPQRPAGTRPYRRGTRVERRRDPVRRSGPVDRRQRPGRTHDARRDRPRGLGTRHAAAGRPDGWWPRTHRRDRPFGPARRPPPGDNPTWLRPSTRARSGHAASTAMSSCVPSRRCSPGWSW